MLTAIALMVALLSCGVSPNDAGEYVRIPEGGWVYGDSLRFTPSIADSVADGRLVVAVSHNNNYVYSNIWLEVTRLNSQGRETRDTLNMRLSDEYGRWNGSGFGSGYQLSDTVPGVTRIVRDSAIVIRHVMRTDLLEDIEQIGVIFVSTER